MRNIVVFILLIFFCSSCLSYFYSRNKNVKESFYINEVKDKSFQLMYVDVHDSLELFYIDSIRVHEYPPTPIYRATFKHKKFVKKNKRVYAKGNLTIISDETNTRSKFYCKITKSEYLFSIGEEGEAFLKTEWNPGWKFTDRLNHVDSKLSLLNDDFLNSYSKVQLKNETFFFHVESSKGLLADFTVVMKKLE